MKKVNALLGLTFAAVLAAGVGVTTLTANADVAEAIVIAEGASVRYSNPTGIRFTAYVNDSYFEDGALKTGVTVGMKISVDGVEKDFSTANAETAWKWAESDKDGYQKYHVVIGGAEGADFPAEEYATALTATAYVTDENGTEVTPSVTRSIAQVANAALAENKLLTYIKSDEVLTEEQVTALDAYTAATTAISMDNHISLAGETLTWKPVANAKGYFVRYGEKILNVVDDGRTGAYTLALAEFGQANSTNGEVNIVVYGDGVNYTYENLACEYANLYKVDVAGTAGVNGVARGYLKEFNDAYNSVLNAENTEEGTKVTARSAGCRTVFALTLAEGLNMTKYEGIKVTFKVIKSDHKNPAEKAYGLKLVGKGTYNQGYFNDYDSYRCRVDLNEEGTLVLTNEDLDKWYDEGDTQIAFMQYFTYAEGAAADDRKWQEFLIMDVSYIRSSKPTYTYTNIVNFNSESDAAKIVAGNPESKDSRIKNTFRYSETAMFNATAGDSGAGYAHLLQSNGWSNVNVFIVTIVLDQAIDLTNQDGIQVRFRVSWISANTTGSDSVYFRFVSPINANGTTPVDYTTQPEGESGVCKSFLLGDDFATLKISAEDLKAMNYEGKTQLTFAIFAPNKATSYGQSAEVFFDDISYYKADS
jgi:hypothetical protein